MAESVVENVNEGDGNSKSTSRGKAKGGQPPQSHQHKSRRNKGYNRLARRARIYELLLVAIVAWSIAKFDLDTMLLDYLGTILS